MGSPLPKPARIGKYEVTEVIGRGGMGIVYRATDPRIGRPVAIKVLTGIFSEDSELLARFYREAKSTGSLQHQNIVTVYELGDQDGFPYLVMEYLEGESLDSIISSHRPLSISEKLGIMIRVLDGLSFAHERGIIHRDIKPANIVVLKNGTVKIVDFGIAHVGGNRLTRTGEIVGSIYYMSPEQLNDSGELDARTDVYSAGVVLFQLLTGVLPFEGRDTSSTLLKIVRDPAPPLNKFISLYPPELEAISQKALMKDRDRRYTSAEDLAFDLTRLQQQLNQEVLADHLRKALFAMEHKDFFSARQEAMQLLRVDPQHAEGKRLLRESVQALESQKRKQQAILLTSQAEEALSGKNLDAALQYAEQAVQQDPDNPDIRSLLNKVVHVREQTAKYSEALARAKRSQQRGDLENASQALAEAIAILPAESEARTLKARIDSAIGERSRKSNDSQSAKRQIALAINSVERAMADARLQMYLNQPREAWAILEKAGQDASNVPAELRSQLEALARQVIKELSVQSQGGSAPTQVLDEMGRQNDSATSAEFDAFHSPPSQSRSMPPPSSRSMPRETMLFPNPPSPEDTLHSHPNAPTGIGEHHDAGRTYGDTVVPEDLKEFLPPPSERSWGWPVVGIVVVAIALAGGFYWMNVNHKPQTHSQTAVPQTTAPSVVAADTTYAEVNAGPWGTVKEVRSMTGQTVRLLNDQTPTRVELPAGRYQVSVEGPNGEKKTVQVEVPEHGGSSYFVLFHKPDIQRIIGAK
jgi:serine/threonine protein kinase